MNKNCHSPRTSNDIDMKLGLVTKLDEKNPATSKKNDNNFKVGLSPSKHFVVFA